MPNSSEPVYEHFHIVDKRYITCGVYRRAKRADGTISSDAFMFPEEKDYPGLGECQGKTLERFDLELSILEHVRVRNFTSPGRLEEPHRSTIRSILLEQSRHLLKQPKREAYYRLLDCKTRALGYYIPGQGIKLYDEDSELPQHPPLPQTLPGFDLGWFAVDNACDLTEFWDQATTEVREKLRATLMSHLPVTCGVMVAQLPRSPRTMTAEGIEESRKAVEACQQFHTVGPAGETSPIQDLLDAAQLSLTNVKGLIYKLPVNAPAEDSAWLETWKSKLEAAIEKARPPC